MAEGGNVSRSASGRKLVPYVVGAIVGAVLGVLLFSRIAPTPRTEGVGDVTLQTRDGRCQATDKTGVITVRRGNHVRWSVKNDCNEHVTAMVADFRISGEPNDCTVAGQDCPFDDCSENARSRPVPQGPPKTISLKTKESDDPREYIDYRYIVCLKGATEGAPFVKADPILKVRR